MHSQIECYEVFLVCNRIYRRNFKCNKSAQIFAKFETQNMLSHSWHTVLQQQHMH